MANGGLNNNSYNYNNNGEEITNTSNETSFMSKIVGKFPIDVNGTNSPFSTTYIKPQNGGLIPTYKAQNFVNYNTWKKNDSHEAIDQWKLLHRKFFSLES